VCEQKQEKAKRRERKETKIASKNEKEGKRKETPITR
jgi:hypothetical protein